MSALIWTFLLVSTGVGGLWLSAKHWQGWALYALNEVLWFAYALHTADTALAIMAVVWFAVGVRNFLVTKKASAAWTVKRVGSPTSEGFARHCPPGPHSHNGIGQCGTDPATW